MPVAHQSSVVCAIALGGETDRGPAAEELVDVVREALREEHPDREAFARGGVVVAGGIPHQEQATLGDRAGALVELGRAERARGKFPLA